MHPAPRSRPPSPPAASPDGCPRKGPEPPETHGWSQRARRSSGCRDRSWRLIGAAAIQKPSGARPLRPVPKDSAPPRAASRARETPAPSRLSQPLPGAPSLEPPRRGRAPIAAIASPGAAGFHSAWMLARISPARDRYIDAAPGARQIPRALMDCASVQRARLRALPAHGHAQLPPPRALSRCTATLHPALDPAEVLLATAAEPGTGAAGVGAAGYGGVHGWECKANLSIRRA